MALGCMLAQLDDSGKERAIYHLSRRILAYECRYIMIERLCLALVWATRRLRHYVTEYSILLFDRPVLASRLMRWLVLLTEFDIQYFTQKSVKGSIVADHLASLPVSNDRLIDDDFSDEQFVSVTNIAGWQLYFDGAANQLGFGIDILLISPQGDHIPRLVRLAFSDHRRLTNNIVEYEACITGLETTLDLGVRQLEIHGDSNLVIQQTQDCCQFVQRCLECQMHGDLIHVPPSELHALTSSWPFLVWGIDVIGKISPKSSNGHEYILVAVDYFTKWVEAASYARLTAAKVAKFIRSHIIITDMGSPMS
uniref:Integrase catalytic domain-containing protein n=1 Tax=Vitis vinifera TaxID=29760 RepID=A5BBQ8_VITVI|nr:hypothetical protein VITISV_014943 [Vitis vinifera]